MIYVQASKDIQEILAEIERIDIQDPNCCLAVLGSEYINVIPETNKPVLVVVNTLMTLTEAESVYPAKLSNKETLLEMVREMTASLNKPMDTGFTILFDSGQDKINLAETTNRMIKPNSTPKKSELTSAVLNPFPSNLSDTEQITPNNSFGYKRKPFTQRGMVIAIFSTKGGVGKTTIATNIAALYAMKGQKTILVDVDIGAGDAPEKLGMSSALKPNLSNWRTTQKLDIHKHSSGLFLLPAGPDPELTIQEEDVEALICTLENQFDVVILDYGVRPFHQHTRTGLDLADKVFLIADQEQNMIDRFVSQFIAERSGWLKQGKAELVVNMVSPLKYYRPADVAKKAGCSIWYEIPEAPGEFRAAAKAGKAVVQLPRAQAAQEFFRMIGEAPEQKKGFLSWFRRAGA